MAPTVTECVPNVLSVQESYLPCTAPFTAQFGSWAHDAAPRTHTGLGSTEKTNAGDAYPAVFLQLQEKQSWRPLEVGAADLEGPKGGVAESASAGVSLHKAGGIKAGAAENASANLGRILSPKPSVAAPQRQRSGSKVAPWGADDEEEGPAQEPAQWPAQGAAHALPRASKPLALGPCVKHEKVQAARERLLQLEVQRAHPSVRSFLMELSLAHSPSPRPSIAQLTGALTGVPRCPACAVVSAAAPRYHSEGKTQVALRTEGPASAAGEPAIEGVPAGAFFSGAETAAARTTANAREEAVNGAEKFEKRQSLSAVACTAASKCGRALSRAGRFPMQALGQMQDFMHLHPLRFPA